VRITQAELNERLHYNPDTGIFTWLPRPIKLFASTRAGKTWNTRFADKPAGSIQKITGYLRITIDRKLYKSHRLAFLYMLGGFPKDQVDHINHIPDDNRWENLREVSHQENQRNLSLRRNNKSGHVGVSWHKQGKKWQSRIRVSGKFIHLGLFTDKADAVKARQEASIKYGYHENHGT